MYPNIETLSTLSINLRWEIVILEVYGINMHEFKILNLKAVLVAFITSFNDVNKHMIAKLASAFIF